MSIEAPKMSGPGTDPNTRTKICCALIPMERLWTGIVLRLTTAACRVGIEGMKMRDQRRNPKNTRVLDVCLGRVSDTCFGRDVCLRLGCVSWGCVLEVPKGRARNRIYSHRNVVGEGGKHDEKE
eukprot:912975-Amorphochlora_amoeboformis.AAC.1